ncbi:MAG: AAA family ATPase, partial [Planctomycetes bacterium]|nr:AAA family ATPase [Planctomycetota bacterium]
MNDQADPRPERKPTESAGELTVVRRPAGATGPSMFVPGEMAAGAVQPWSRAAKPRATLALALRHKWTIAIVALLVSGPIIAGAWLLVQPWYEARAEIRVRPIIPRLVFQTEDNGMIPLYQSYMNTQVSIVRNPTVLQRVLDKTEVQRTRWYKGRDNGLLSLVTSKAGTPMERLLKDLKVSPRPRTEIIDLRISTHDRRDCALILNTVLDEYIKYHSEISDQKDDWAFRELSEKYRQLKNEIEGHEKVIKSLQKRLGTSDPQALISQQRIRLDQARAKLADIHQQISVLEQQKKELDSYIIFRNESNKEIARLQYVRTISEMPPEARRRLYDQVARECSALEKDVASCRDQLGQIRAGNLLSSLRMVGLWMVPLADPNRPSSPDLPADGTEAIKLEARQEILNRELEMLRIRRDELAKLLPAEPAAEPKAEPVVETAARGFENDPEWRRLDMQLRQAQNLWRTQSRLYRESHPRMIALKNQIEFAKEALRVRETQLAQEQMRAPRRPEAPADTSAGLQPITLAKTNEPDYEAQLNELKRKLSVLRHQEKLQQEHFKAMQAEFDDIFAQAENLAKATEEVRAKREVFTAVRNRLDQKQMERNVPGAIEPLRRAQVPSRPASDRRYIMTVLALLLGLGAGFGAAVLRSAHDTLIYDPDEIIVASAAPLLGQLPLLQDCKDHSPPDDDPIVNEYIRMVRTALMTRIDGQGQALLVSSAEEGAGKSTVARILARSLARSGKDVLLVDADLRKSDISRRYGLVEKPGFLDCLDRRTVRPDAIFATETPGLSVMPRGTGRADGQSGSELTANGAFAVCLEKLRSEFDFIVFDSSPILPVADARIISRQVDGTLLVVREERCRRDDVTEAA